MTYQDIISAARKEGKATEKNIQAAAERLSQDLFGLKQKHAGIYQTIIRNQHAAYFGKHYSEQMAHCDVDDLEWSADNEDGEAAGYGARWTTDELERLTTGMHFHARVNMWDKFVAFNAMYADLCRFMDEDEIIKAAYAFYFHDNDWQNDGDCTKIWDYMTHHYLSLEEDTAASFLA